MFSDPGMTQRPGLFSPWTRSPQQASNEDSLHCGFRGSIARPQHSLSTPRSPRSPEVHARLASGCRPALPDGIGYPQDSNERFQLCFVHSILLSQVLRHARLVPMEPRLARYRQLPYVLVRHSGSSQWGHDWCATNDRCGLPYRLRGGIARV